MRRLVEGDWKTDWDQSPWCGREPTEEEIAAWEGVITDEPVHLGVRLEERFARELGYILKLAGGVGAVTRAVELLRDVKEPELIPLRVMLDSWAQGGCRSEHPTCTLDS